MTLALLEGVTHRYGAVAALSSVTLAVPAGGIAGLIGPDAVGKSTLLGLVAGVRRIQSGRITVLGGDLSDGGHRKRCAGRIAYIPQGLGRNLYPALSVGENLAFFARLFGAAHGSQRAASLLEATGLAEFVERPAGKLSGGMKQKLALCCALIHEPDLLVMDEPTTGIDPLSRRQFWRLIERLRTDRPDMGLLVATGYMEEAARFDWLAAMDDGRVLAAGRPADLLAASGSDRLDDAFVALLPPERQRQRPKVVIPPLPPGAREPAIEAAALTRRFGSFTAVDDVSFRIAGGEIFGFLGSNGCGKTTTMKMLTGLLPATSGEARLFGQVLQPGDRETRRRVGYMTQGFSLYGELSVRRNLLLQGQLYGMAGKALAERVEGLLHELDLARFGDSPPQTLPLGVRQRVQLAAAMIHRPEVLILDEPTSGVDPIARDQFWQQLVTLSRRDGVTIFISTHFLNEAERCDRICLMHAGKVLATGAPAALAGEKGDGTFETAAIRHLEEAEARHGTQRRSDPVPRGKDADAHSSGRRRLYAYAWRETLELMRDPVRLFFALVGPVLLLVAFGYGISFDVENISFAVHDQDRSRESRVLVEAFAGSRYFRERPPIADHAALERRLRSGEIRVAIDIPAGFGRRFMQGGPAELAFWIDGAIPFRGETIRGYVGGIAAGAMADQDDGRAAAAISIEPRFLFNQAFTSVNAIVPGVVMLMLVLIPSMMTAVAVVRERETGSIANFRTSPVTKLEFLLGKQLPYVAIGMASFGLMLLVARWLFGVPVKGSGASFGAATLLYLAATTGFGLLMSSFMRTQVAAVFATAIVVMIPAINFSGMLTPVSSLSGPARLAGLGFPSSWFQQASIGAFAKAQGFAELWPYGLVLLAFAVAFVGLAALLLRKQEP